MENASKALIIAGAILLSILIIGLGMSIYNSATTQMENSIGQMSQTEKQTHNQQFLNYAGNNKRGTDVIALVNIITQVNALALEKGQEDRVPGVAVEGFNVENLPTEKGKGVDGPAFNNLRRAIKPTALYEVRVDVGPKTGIVENITIKQK